MKKILLILMIGTFLASCSDQLERTPKDQIVPDKAYKSVEDLQLGLSGVYSSLQVNSIIALNSIMMDNCKIGADTGGQQVDLYNLVLNPENGVDQDIYQIGYITANRASRIIAAAEAIEPTEAELEEYNYILAQCYALRAYAHYNIFSHYTADMTDLAGMSIPYIDFVITDINFFPSRNTVQEVKTMMFADLDMADSLMGGNGDIVHVNPDFTTFLRARMELVTGNNTKAIEYSNELIAKYPLADQTQYVNMFLDTDNTEVVFKKDLTDNEVRIGGVWYFTGTGGAFIEMSNELYNQLDPADVRTQVLLAPDSDPANNIHNIGKYPGSEGFDYMNDYKAMRISEIYLIKAEAQARLDQYVPAATTIKELRDARFGTSTTLDVYSTKFEALSAILAERRIELAFEGHRYIDLRRFRSDLNQGMDRAPADCSNSPVCEIPASDRRFVLPIPQREVLANPNLDQTPVWK